MVKRSEIDRKRRKGFVMPMGYGDRLPVGSSPLSAFIESCSPDIKHGLISLFEAVEDYQENWCSHGRQNRILIATRAQPSIDLYEYEVQCTECGLVKTLQGRPPSWLNRQR
jgi:hypothetical protein